MADTTRTRPDRRRLRAVLALTGAALAGRLRRYEIAEQSMRPTLHHGDWVVAVARPRRLTTGDVVVFDHPVRSGFELVKRIQEIRAEGLWVLGDDLSAGSIDSRTFGTIEFTAVTARVVARYRPRPLRLIR